MLKSARPIILFVATAILLGGPIVFLFADPKAMPLFPGDPLAGIYSALVALLGVPLARVAWCGAWLALDAAIFWRIFLSKNKHKVDLSSVDDLAD